MHQTKKGNQWHFGLKAHIGADSDSGAVHSIHVTAANESDVANAHHLLHGQESDVHADAGFTGVEKREEVKAAQDEGRIKADVNWHVAERRHKIKAMPEGFLSSHLVDGIEPGIIVRLADPQGNFVLPDPAPEKVLFLTAGSGVTPIMSMLRTLDRRDQITDVVHVHSAPRADDVLFGAELAALHDAHPSYRLLLRETRTQGRLALDRLDEVVPDWRERQAWACGPGAMLADAERVWGQAGLPDNLHLEHFAVSRAEPHGAGGTVTFARTGKSVTVDAATSVLEAGEGVGELMPFGCRMGICQSCVVELVDGHVRDLRTGVEHEPGTRIQTCVSAPSGDCTVNS